MKKTNENLICLNVVFCVSLIMANITVSKVWDTGISILGIPLLLPGTGVNYAITFLVTDVIGEIWGKEEANKTVIFGLLAQVISSAMIYLACIVPGTSPEIEKAFDMVLGVNWLFFIASMIAYFASQTWDVYFFHKIRNIYISKHGTTKGGRWIWNNASTMTSQLIDSVLFVGVSFGLGFGWLFIPDMQKKLALMIIGRYVVRFLMAALDTPFFYILTQKSEQ